MMNEQRFEIINKYNPNELILDNLFVMDDVPQLYGVECVVNEMNSMNNCLNRILEVCNDCLKIEDIYDV